MSFNIPMTSLVGAVVGQTGSIPIPTNAFTPSAFSADERSHIRLFNESGCGLLITTQVEQQNINVPAGNWPMIDVSPTEKALLYQVLYVLPGAPVAQLLGTYYVPGEPIDDVGPLGNSPIGIGGP